MPLREGSALRSAEVTYPAAQLQTLQSVFGWLDLAYDKVAVEHAVQAVASGVRREYGGGNRAAI